MSGDKSRLCFYGMVFYAYIISRTAAVGELCLSKDFMRKTMKKMDFLIDFFLASRILGGAFASVLVKR